MRTRPACDEGRQATTRKYIGLTSEQIAEYAERMSDHLFSAIREGKFNSTRQMSHFNVEEAIKFLNQQGFEVSLTMTDEPQQKAIAGKGG
jgi:hypothetical protein